MSSKYLQNLHCKKKIEKWFSDKYPENDSIIQQSDFYDRPYEAFAGWRLSK
jgi:hypothetical protein